MIGKEKNCKDCCSPQFAEYIKGVKHSDTLLYTVKEVAFLCGFDDPKYFSTAYKRKKRISPSKK